MTNDELAYEIVRKLSSFGAIKDLWPERVSDLLDRFAQGRPHKERRALTASVLNLLVAQGHVVRNGERGTKEDTVAITETGEAWFREQGYLVGVKFMVEAAHNERLCFWERREVYGIKSWEQDNPGYVIQVGKFHGRPVNVCLDFEWIDSHKVCFYEGISELVDHKMIEDWVRKHGIRKTNSSNFHHCLDHLRRLAVPHA